MTPEDREILKDVITSPSRMREKYFQNNYSDILERIITLYPNESMLFIDKVYHYWHEIPRTMCITCGIVPTTMISFANGFRPCCSAKCTQNRASVKEKRKNSTIEKYGVENVAKNSAVRNKTIKTNLERYGHESSAMNSDVIEKRKATVQEKYGVEYTTQADDVKLKIKATHNERYGGSFTKTEEYRQKTIATNQEKFGVDYPMQNPDFKSNTNKTVLKKYGSKWYGGSVDHQKKVRKFVVENLNGIYPINHPNVVSKRVAVAKGKRKIRIAGFGYEIISIDKNIWTLSTNECGHTFQLSRGSFDNRLKANEIICTVCNPFVLQQSAGERNLGEWLRTDVGVDFIERDRTILKPYELDLYSAAHQYAIEYNGLYYHSDLFERKVDSLYKTDKCKDAGIHLTHVWEDDWLTKGDIVRSLIRAQLGKSERRVYGRECIVGMVDNITAKAFLEQNHLQGAAQAKTRYGLYHNGELVSLMTFGVRKFLNKKETATELVRFCNKLNTVIVGGASKLWKHFIKEEAPSRVVSYCDRGVFKGDMYKQLGFGLDHVSQPGYQWVMQGKRMHRYNFTKQKLIAQGYDGTKTEVAIMHERGAYRVFDSGQEFYVWSKEKDAQ